MVASSTKPASSAVAVTERPSSDHPAYWPLFAYYRQSGQSATRALSLLTQNWDEEVQGPLPSARTARHWARVDAWDAKIDEAAEASVIQDRAYVELQLLRSALDALASLNRVINGEVSDPKLASAMGRAAFRVLERAGFDLSSRRRKAKTAQVCGSQSRGMGYGVSRSAPSAVERDIQGYKADSVYATWLCRRPVRNCRSQVFLKY